MKFYIYGDNISVTEAMQEKIEKKLSFLEKYFVIEEDTMATVRVKLLPDHKKVEVSIPTKIGLLRAEVKHEDFYAAVDLAIDKLEEQIQRQKSRLSRRHKEKLSTLFVDDEENVDPLIDEDEDEVVRTKLIKIEKMDLEEAILRMEMLGHSFFLYRDDETNAAAVVYKREEGGYGLLESDE